MCIKCFGSCFKAVYDLLQGTTGERKPYTTSCVKPNIQLKNTSSYLIATISTTTGIVK